MRITSDCPFIDFKILDKMIELHLKTKSDYTTNDLPATFPDGLDIEIFKSKILIKAQRNLKTNSPDREHVTSIMRKNPKIKILNFKSKEDFSFLRLTLDEKEDQAHRDPVRTIPPRTKGKQDPAWTPGPTEEPYQLLGQLA